MSKQPAKSVFSLIVVELVGAQKGCKGGTAGEAQDENVQSGETALDQKEQSMSVSGD